MKVVLLSSMVGLLVGLVVATVMESEHPAPPRGYPLPGLNDQLNPAKEMIKGNNPHDEKNHV